MSDIESLHNSPTKLPLPLDLPPTMSQMKLSHKGMIVLNFPSLSRLRVGSCGSNWCFCPVQSLLDRRLLTSIVEL